MKKYRSEIIALTLEEDNQRDSQIAKIMYVTSVTRSLLIRRSQYAIFLNLDLSSLTLKKVSGYVRNHNCPCFRDQMIDSQSMMGKSRRQSQT